MGDKMSDKRKDVRLEVKLKNNLILRRMEAMGINSVLELARRMGKPELYTHLNALIGIKMKARRNDGRWRTLAEDLATFFKCLPEDLFSELQQHNSVSKKRAMLEVSSQEVLGALQNRHAGSSPELLMQAGELRDAVAKALTSLTPRLERIIALRFGLQGNQEMTLEEVAALLDVSRASIRKLEAKALRKLKHPARKRLLREALGMADKDDGYPCGGYYKMDTNVLDALLE